MTDNKLIQQYKEIISTYIEKEDERSLYEVSGFARACLAQDLGPETLVEMHSSVLSELVEGRDTEVRELVARANQVLLEGMMTCGLVYQELLERKSSEYKALEVYTKKIEKQAEQLKTLYNEIADGNIRLQELDQLKSMFIASMSHELRTPINSIIGFTGIILQGLVGELNEEQRKQLTMVKNSAKHLLALINDVIDVSKIEAGKIKLAIEEFDLSALVLEVKDSFEVATEEKGLKMSLKKPEKLTIKSDERRTKQVIMNLVSNAVKFTDEGKIEIKLTKKDRMAEMSVKDTGVGIKKEDLDRLFKAFSQVPSEGRPKQEGTGLGLYLSKKIVKLLGGEIWAESEVGKGSVFTFSLPLKYE